MTGVPAAYDLVWLVPALPLGGFVVNLFLGKRLRASAGALASALVAASLAISVAIFVGLLSHPDTGGFVKHVFNWIEVDAFHASANLRIDALSVTMILVVTGVGLLIHIYSIGYMAEDLRYGRFFAYLNLFVFFMLVLVLADNYLVLYVGWEGVGLCSYLLIGFWFDRQRAANAAKKAFITTRIGDTAMLVGLALIVVHFGTLNFGAVLGRAHGLSTGVATAIALLLFAGAVGKSAQFPLHVWLPDAMEGPTPVSALIHAATMVTAGVYLVVRSHVLFEASGSALTVVLIIGLFTAFYAATAAIGQDDIKRVLAYSTLSQLGYMFFAAGMRAYALAMLLLVVHAFYKALMFLSAGNVLHGLHDEQDMKKMGALRSKMPATWLAFSLGALALSGFPLLAGFFAKDHILSFASQSGRPLAYTLGTITAFLSAFYIARLIFLTFYGEDRTEHEAHESPSVMLGPLVPLAIGAMFGGVLGISAESGALARFLEPVTGALPATSAGLSEGVLVAISIVIALAGIAVAWLLYASGQVDWLALRVRVAPLQGFLNHGWYVDDAYAAVVQTPVKAGAAFTAYVVDLRVVDGAVNGIGRLVRSLARAGRTIQTGFVRSYALALLVGAVAIFVYLGFRL